MLQITGESFVCLYYTIVREYLIAVSDVISVAMTTIKPRSKGL